MVFTQSIIEYDKFYINHWQTDSSRSSWIFVHGGPGLNSAILERFIENQTAFSTFPDNIIVYDQRGCGRSNNNILSVVTHEHNIKDLYNIFCHLRSSGIKIKGFIAHSYGAKLLLDMSKLHHVMLPVILIATASNIAIPRINNLLLDLNYLKATESEKYQNWLKANPQLDLANLWAATESLAETYKKNPNRLKHYWANLEIMNLFEVYRKEINLPIQEEIFSSVRKSLYQNIAQFDLHIEDLNFPILWINGFHDYIMNGALTKFNPHNPNQRYEAFYRSSHYPHLEESERFCELANEFIKTL